jgi:hypothetical protein
LTNSGCAKARRRKARVAYETTRGPDIEPRQNQARRHSDTPSVTAASVAAAAQLGCRSSRQAAPVFTSTTLWEAAANGQCSHTNTVSAGCVREHEGRCRPGLRQRRAFRQSRDHHAVGCQVRLADRRVGRALARTGVSGQPRCCGDRVACRVEGAEAGQQARPTPAPARKESPRAAQPDARFATKPVTTPALLLKASSAGRVGPW